MGLGTRMGLPAVGGWRTALEGSVPLSPQTDAVFAQLARDLAREERAAVLVEASLGATRELREGPHDRPLPLGSPRDPVRTTIHVLNVVPGEVDLLPQLRQGLGPAAGVVNELLILAKVKKRVSTLLALQVSFKKAYLKSQ